MGVHGGVGGGDDSGEVRGLGRKTCPIMKSWKILKRIKFQIILFNFDSSKVIVSCQVFI